MWLMYCTQGSSCLVSSQDQVHQIQKTDFQSTGENIQVMLLWLVMMMATQATQGYI